MGITPRYITFNSDSALASVIWEEFKESISKPCFFYFVKNLWNLASKCGLKKWSISGKVNEIIFKLKSLAFVKPKSVTNYSPICQYQSNGKIPTWVRTNLACQIFNLWMELLWPSQKKWTDQTYQQWSWKLSPHDQVTALKRCPFLLWIHWSTS